MLTLYPFEVANIYHSLNHCTLGFITLHTMETFDNATHENYREMGLGFDNGQQAGAINVRWGVWQPKLRAWLTMGLVILQLTAYPFLLCSMVNATSIWMIGMEMLWFLQHSLFVGCLLHDFILLIIIILLWL